MQKETAKQELTNITKKIEMEKKLETEEVNFYFISNALQNFYNSFLLLIYEKNFVQCFFLQFGLY